MWLDSLAVLGLGALGGSLAWQARQAGVTRVIGYSATTADASQALRAGAISDRADSVPRACRGASLVVVTGGLAAVTRSLTELGPHLEDGAIVTDIAPLRQPVQESVRVAGLSNRHAGSAPVVTVRETGFHAAGPALFQGAMVYVCPSSPDDTAARGVARFWSDVMGAQPVIMPAEAIDRRTAWRHQLPALIKAAISRASSRHGPADSGVAAGESAGELDELVALLLANRLEMLRGLEGVDASLAEMRACLVGEDRAGLRALLESSTGIQGDPA